MPFQHNKPFDDLPKLPPKATVESPRLLKRAASARGALGELKGVSKLLPNETILLNTLILEEARDSSEIENIVTTRDKLYRALASGSKNVDPATKEVLRYRSALWKGFGLVQEKGFISTNMIVDVQQGIIRELLSNFETFLNGQTELDPLIAMAVLHYQFEAIHPFYDGNGRTGRIVNVLYLVLKGLLDLPILYVSSFIIDRKADYYRLLLRVTTRGEWEPWILFMLEAVEATAIDTVKKVNAIRDSLEETIEEVREKLPRIYTKELVELLFHQPYSKVAFLVDANLAERKAAARYLNALEHIGLLKSKKVGKEKIFLNQRLFDLFSQKSKR